MTASMKKVLLSLYSALVILHNLTCVSAWNSCPVAKNDLCAAVEDTAVNMTVIDYNDSDADENDVLLLVHVTQPPNGRVFIGHDGRYVTFVPDENYYGVQAFEYTISDGTCYESAQVFVIVRSKNDVPIARGDDEITDRDTAVTIDVLKNDFDVDLGDLIKVAEIISPPANGIVTISPDNKTITYSPTSDFIGNDAFVYSITDGKTAEIASARVNIRVRNKKTVTDEQGLCGATLDSNTAYFLEDDVVCPDGVKGPTLMDGAVLYCQGRTLAGNTATTVKPGVTMAGTGSEIFDCAVTGFHVAIEMAGANNVVRNVALSDYAFDGIYNDQGSDNSVYCSTISGVGSGDTFGISSTSLQPFHVVGVSIVDNYVGMLVESGTVSCADVREAEIGTVLQGGTVEIEDSVFIDSDFAGVLLDSGTGHTLSGISSCGSGLDDIFLASDDPYLMSTSNDLACDKSFPSQSLCDDSCPPNGRPTLPSTCSVECPVVGLRTKK